MAFAFKNKAITYLDAPLGAASTNIIVGSGEGDKFPSPSGGDLSPLVLEDRLTGAYEIVHMTSRNGDQLNVLRAQESTLAQSWPVGSNLSLRATQAVYDTFDSFGARIEQNEDDIADLQTAGNVLIQTVVNALYPVGALYMSTSSDNPRVILGVGTWVAHAQGRAIVGVGNNGESTWTGGQARGEEEHTLTVEGLPVHNHTLNGITMTTSTHRETFSFKMQRGDESQSIIFDPVNITQTLSSNANTVDSSNNPTRQSLNQEWNIDHSHTVNFPTGTGTQSKGNGGAHNNVQPSIGIYIWRRTEL